MRTGQHHDVHVGILVVANHYPGDFAMGPAITTPVTKPYQFTLDVNILDNPALKAFVPGLTRIDSVNLRSRFSDRDGWTASLRVPAVDMGVNQIRNLYLNAGTNQDAIDMVTTIERFSSGPSVQLNNTSITARIADNKINFTLNNKDAGNRDKYNISGLFQQPSNGEYVFSIRPEGFVLNYDTWNVAANNRILLTNAGVNASNFNLSRAGQQLSINSLAAGANSPLEVTFNQFRLATLTGFVQTDSTLINGLLNGKVAIEHAEIKSRLIEI
ncbi:MAG: hypothetical protein EOP49_47340 [Sphingobacteriales bacterium]|nr:MAG: hypothetical protein EOP49_47340 [Sphingobacteriales bacterium]